MPDCTCVQQAAPLLHTKARMKGLGSGGSGGGAAPAWGAPHLPELAPQVPHDLWQKRAWLRFAGSLVEWIAGPVANMQYVHEPVNLFAYCNSPENSPSKTVTAG